MTILLIGLWSLLFLKLVWNTIVPIELHRQRDAAERGTSMMFAVEWLIAVLLLGVSALWRGDHWYDAPGSVAFIGFGSIIASYLLMPVAAMVAKFVINHQDGDG